MHQQTPIEIVSVQARPPVIRIESLGFIATMTQLTQTTYRAVVEPKPPQTFWDRWLPTRWTGMYRGFKHLPPLLQAFLATVVLGVLLPAAYLVRHEVPSFSLAQVVVWALATVTLVILTMRGDAAWMTGLMMTVSAYRESGPLTPVEIIKRPPRNEGAADAVMPMMLAVVLGYWLGARIHVSPLFTQLLLAIATHVIDDVYPWGRIPVFSHVSRWLSRTVLTLPPDPVAVQLACEAIERLQREERLAAHRRAPT